MKYQRFVYLQMNEYLGLEYTARIAMRIFLLKSLSHAVVGYGLDIYTSACGGEDRIELA